MLLVHDQIIEAYKAGMIIIEPYDQSCVTSASYDVRLGEHFWYEQIPDKDSKMMNIYNPYSAKSIGSVWRKGKAAKVKDLISLSTVDERYLDGLDGEDKVIFIPPRSMILAHTEEFIGSACNTIIPEMHSRSTTVRNFLDVCGSGGWGDHGYCNRWTMEITNTSKYHVVVLLVGARIAQISFMLTSKSELYQNLSGNYDPILDMEAKKRQWVPEMMLPRVSK